MPPIPFATIISARRATAGKPTADIQPRWVASIIGPVGMASSATP